jgi:hypothetical protein
VPVGGSSDFAAKRLYRTAEGFSPALKVAAEVRL